MFKNNITDYTHCVTDTAELKGQLREILDLQFLLSFEPAWATDQRVKIVSNLVMFSPSYLNFSIEKKLTPRSMILRGVKQMS